MKYTTGLLITAALALGIWGIVATTSGPPRQFDAAPPAPAPLGADSNQTPVIRAENPVDPVSAEIQSLVPEGNPILPQAGGTSATEAPSTGANVAGNTPVEAPGVIRSEVTPPAPQAAGDGIPSLTDAQMRELGFLP